MKTPIVENGSALSEDARGWLSEPIRQALAMPPPRPRLPGLLGNLATGGMRGAFWVGVALTNVGGLYSVIFVVLGAPWQIPAAAAAVAFAGVLSLAISAAGVAGRVRLFRHGSVTTGVLVRMGRPGPGSRRPLFGTSIEVVYRFSGLRSREHRGASTILWDDRFSEMENGDSLEVLYLPERPGQNLPLIALV